MMADQNGRQTANIEGNYKNNCMVKKWYIISYLQLLQQELAEVE